MIDRPVMENVEDKNTIEDSIVEEQNSYDYHDNLTAKLGGNYAKIIEFYDSRL